MVNVFNLIKHKILYNGKLTNRNIFNVTLVSLRLHIEERIISFCLRICNRNENDLPNKLSAVVYRSILNIITDYDDTVLKLKYPWFYHAKTIFY